MGVLDRFEQRLDRLVNGAFARAFKSEVQPVEIAAALQRECDDRAAIVDPRPHRRAERLHRRARSARPRPPRQYARAARRRAGRDGPRARRGAGLPVRRPGAGRASSWSSDLDTGVFRGPTARPLSRRRYPQAARPRSRPATDSQRVQPWRVTARPTARAGHSRPARLPLPQRHDHDRPRRRVRHPDRRPRHLAHARPDRAGRPAAASIDLGSTNGTCVDGRAGPEAAAVRRRRTWPRRLDHAGLPVRRVSGRTRCPTHSRCSSRSAFLVLLWVLVLIGRLRSCAATSFAATSHGADRGRRGPAGQAGEAGQAGRKAHRGAPEDAATSPSRVRSPDERSQLSRRDAGHPRPGPRQHPRARRRLRVGTATRGCARTRARWVVEDLGSTNGTYLDSTRSPRRRVVPDRRSRQVGKTLLELRK